MRWDIMLGVVTASITFLGAFASFSPAKTKKRKVAYLLGFGLLCAVSIFLIVLQSDGAAQTQAGLREKLNQSLLTEENMRGQLQSISLMVGKISEGSQESDIRRLASAIKEIAGTANQGGPHMISVTAPGMGYFQVAHKLGCAPSYATIDMTSGGFISWHSPKKMFDSHNLYLTSSAAGVTAKILVWCKP